MVCGYCLFLFLVPDTLSKVAKKTILLSIQLLGELLITKSDKLSVEVEAQVKW